MDISSFKYFLVKLMISSEIKRKKIVRYSVYQKHLIYSVSGSGNWILMLGWTKSHLKTIL